MTNPAQKIQAHTPWRVKETTAMPAHGYGHKATAGTLSVEGVCHMMVRANGDNMPQMREYARLIAAAPELLEALKTLVITCAGAKNPPDRAAAIIVARAALAKVQE